MIRNGRRFQRSLLLALAASCATPPSLFAFRDSPLPPPAPTALGAIFDRANAAVVKLYGPGAGREHGYGTGVLVSPDGRIVTTLSLLVSTGNVQVILSDGRRFDGQLLRSDETRQLALLKIDARDLPFLEPYHSTQLQIGDSLVALGNWFKIAEGREAVSMNRGILSLNAPVAARRLAQQFDYAGPVLIYDAITANPGAAGGPLLDVEGHFVGLVGKVVEAENTFTRINFALPAEEISNFLNEPTATPPLSAGPSTAPTKSAGKPYIGIKLTKLGFRQVSAFVDKVRPGSPAAKAEILPDDLIMAVNGRRISSVDDYDEIVRDLVPGRTVPFTLKRGTQLLTVNVTIGAEP